MSSARSRDASPGHLHASEFENEKADFGLLGKAADDVVVDLKRALNAAPATVDTLAQSSAFPITAYCLASIFMTVLNKFVVSGTDFSMNFLLLAIQSSVCVACVSLSKATGLITHRDFSTVDAKKWFPISTLLVAVIYTGSKSLQFLSIPVYTIFKNLTIILIAYGEVFISGGSVTGLTLVAFALMVFSSVIAAWSDINAAVAMPFGSVAAYSSGLGSGYFWMLLNCLTTAAYSLSMRTRLKALGFKDWDTMFYNNLLSIPVLAIASLVVEDWSAANLTRNFPEETRNFLLFAIMVSGAAAVFISYTTAWCIRTTSSTTYSMVGALNKLPVAASGMLFFGDQVTFGSVSAISTGFFAGVVYAIAKSRQGKAGKESVTLREKESIIPMSMNRRA